MISAADPALIALITHDRRLRTLCEALGERHLAVLPGAEAKFRTALKKLGYVLPER